MTSKLKSRSNACGALEVCPRNPKLRNPCSRYTSHFANGLLRPGGAHPPSWTQERNLALKGCLGPLLLPNSLPACKCRERGCSKPQPAPTGPGPCLQPSRPPAWFSLWNQVPSVQISVQHLATVQRQTPDLTLCGSVSSSLKWAW